jgi:hypothetical protein
MTSALQVVCLGVTVLCASCVTTDSFAIPDTRLIVRATDAVLVHAAAELACTCTENHTPWSLERLLKHRHTGPSATMSGILSAQATDVPGEWVISAYGREFGDPLRTADHHHRTACVPRLTLLFVHPTNPTARGVVYIPLPTTITSFVLTGSIHNDHGLAFTWDAAAYPDVSGGPLSL